MVLELGFQDVAVEATRYRLSGCSFLGCWKRAFRLLRLGVLETDFRTVAVGSTGNGLLGCSNLVLTSLFYMTFL